MRDVIKVLIQRRREVNEVPKPELQALLTDAVVKTQLSRGRVDPCFEKLNERTEESYYKKYNIKETNSQRLVLTPANAL